jgi:hypothetical protein
MLQIPTARVQAQAVVRVNGYQGEAINHLTIYRKLVAVARPDSRENLPLPARAGLGIAPPSR